MRRGFTLIELLVVISIIGVLSTVVLSGMSAARARSKDAQVLLQVRQIINALYLARDENTGNFPSTEPFVRPYCLKASGGCYHGAYLGNATIAGALAPYIPNIPIPPDPPFIYPDTWQGGGYLYYPNITGANPFGAGTYPGTYLMYAQSKPITNCKGYYQGLIGDGFYYCFQNITLYP